MSEKKEIVHADIPRMERWLGVSLLSVVPAIGILVLPAGAALPLAIVTAVLMGAGITMFLRSEASRRKSR